MWKIINWRVSSVMTFRDIDIIFSIKALRFKMKALLKDNIFTLRNQSSRLTFSLGLKTVIVSDSHMTCVNMRSRAVPIIEENQIGFSYTANVG